MPVHGLNFKASNGKKFYQLLVCILQIGFKNAQFRLRKSKIFSLRGGDTTFPEPHPRAINNSHKRLRSGSSIFTTTALVVVIIIIILSLESRQKLYNYSVFISRVGRRKLPDVNFRRQLHTTGNTCLTPSSPALLEILQRKTPLSWMSFNSPAGSAKEIRSMLAFLQGPGSVHRAPEMVGRGHHVGCQ